jgi:hypothetical protein
VVWNWDGSVWKEVSVKTPIDSIISYNSDNLPPSTKPTTAWGDVDDTIDFDTEYKYGEIVNLATFTFYYDYTYSDPTDLSQLPTAAVITETSVNGSSVCSAHRYIQQRNTHEYESVRGPEPVLTPAMSLNGELEFYTDGFVVYDGNNDSIAPITDNNSNEWYEIAGGSQVTIVKIVDPRPLNLAPYDDPLTTDTYSPKYQDKSIIWKIDQELTLNAIHKTNEMSIGDMSQRQTTSNEGLATHVINRPE